MRHTILLFLAVLATTPVAAQVAEPTPREAVIFMRSIIDQVNPGLVIEDSHCATNLPWAIVQHARTAKLDWREVFVLAWQESSFDCHAKNKRDRGGAYGPFQIRRVWESVIGDPRVKYYDPNLAVKRVTKILNYYEETGRHQELIRRQFRYPLLCLYNTGERQDVNMRYCQQVGKKMDMVLQGWQDYQEGRLVAIRD